LPDKEGAANSMRARNIRGRAPSQRRAERKNSRIDTRKGIDRRVIPRKEPI